jgi:hypothetical protein
VVRANQEYVAGVTSYGDPNCSDYGVSTTVSAHATFIANFVGTSPVPEACDTPGDEDGDGLSDCADPDCAADPACQDPDACQTAAVVNCGEHISSTTAGGASVFEGYSCLNQSTEAGPEKGYALTMPAAVQVTVTLTPQAGHDLDLFLLPKVNGTCDVNACIDASLNSNDAQESLTFNVPSGGAYLVVDTWDTPGAYTLTVDCDQDVENCTNLTDDDNNGLVDCADPACAAHPDCVPPEVDGGTSSQPDGGSVPPRPDGGTVSPGPDGSTPDHQQPTPEAGFDTLKGGCSAAGGHRPGTPMVFLFVVLFGLMGSMRRRAGQ